MICTPNTKGMGEKMKITKCCKTKSRMSESNLSGVGILNTQLVAQKTEE